MDQGCNRSFMSGTLVLRNVSACRMRSATLTSLSMSGSNRVRSAGFRVFSRNSSAFAWMARIARLDSSISILKVDAGKQQLHQPENALNFTVHGFPQQFINVILQCPEYLIGAIVPHDFGHHHGFDQAAIERRMFVKFLKLVQGRNDPKSKDAVGLKNVVSQRA